MGFEVKELAWATLTLHKVFAQTWIRVLPFVASLEGPSNTMLLLVASLVGPSSTVLLLVASLAGPSNAMLPFVASLVGSSNTVTFELHYVLVCFNVWKVKH